MEFAERLKELRESKGITQYELSQLVGVDRAYISKIERGDMPPPSDIIIVKIAKTLKVDKEELLLLAHWDKTPPDIQKILGGRIDSFFKKHLGLWKAPLKPEERKIIFHFRIIQKSNPAFAKEIEKMIYEGKDLYKDMIEVVKSITTTIKQLLRELEKYREGITIPKKTRSAIAEFFKEIKKFKKS